MTTFASYADRELKTNQYEEGIITGICCHPYQRQEFIHTMSQYPLQASGSDPNDLSRNCFKALKSEGFY